MNATGNLNPEPPTGYVRTALGDKLGYFEREKVTYVDPDGKMSKTVEMPRVVPFAVSLTFDGSSGDKTLEWDIALAMAEAFAIFKERQRKYGPGNIAAFGEVGCVVRLADKMARLRNLYINGESGASADETMEDTWFDVANYALIGLLCHRGKWPGWTPTQRSLAGGPATAPLDPPQSGGC